MRNLSPKNILIAGLGALGTVFATLLKKQGHAVFALTRERHLPALKDRKVRVAGIWGEHESVLDGIESSINPFKEIGFDLIILTVKSYDTQTAIEQVKPLAGKKTLVILAQNGLGNYETAAAEVGKEHTILARVIFGSKLHHPGSAEVTVIADNVRIGQPDNAVPEKQLLEIASMLSDSGIPTSFARNITAILWDKVLYNAALNPLGALLECTYGMLAENQETRRIMDGIIDEIFSVAQVRAVSLNWKTADEYRNHFYTQLVPPTAKHFPSMYYDVKAGKRTEIDALNGEIVRLAGENGISVPVNKTITGLLRAKETFAHSQ